MRDKMRNFGCGPRWLRNLPRGAAIGAIVGMVIAGLAIAVAFAFLFGWLVMLLWNWLMPAIFNLPHITYWQAWGLVLLSHILIKGGWGSSGGGKHDKDHGHDEWCDDCDSCDYNDDCRKYSRGWRRTANGWKRDAGDVKADLAERVDGSAASGEAAQGETRGNTEK
jgi:hypothetical protein